MTEPTEQGGENLWTDCAAARWCSGHSPMPRVPGRCCRASSTSPAPFHWPELVQQFSTLALLIGFPIVVVIAWYHGDRGEQRVSGAELTIIVLLLLLAGGFLWHYRQPGEKSAAPGSVAGPVPAADGAGGHASRRETRPPSLCCRSRTAAASMTTSSSSTVSKTTS